MARFNIIRPKRTPNWVLSLLVGFPYDRGAEYADAECESVINGVLDYVRSSQYLRRNAWECLGSTHFITSTDRSIIISTPNGVPQLTISLN